MPTPPLRLRRVAIDTWRENVAFLHRDCPAYRSEGFQALAKVDIESDGHAIAATLNIVDDSALVAVDELGLSEHAFEQLGLAAGTPVQVAHAEPPASMPALRRKISGERLDRDAYLALMRDVAALRYSKLELAAFVVATRQLALDRDEVLYLTEAMIAVGRRIDWHEPLVVDKHCIGGIPGNRTSMIAVPIVAVHADGCRMLVPKTSSRAITSPAGTADTMECLAEVELDFERLKRIVRTLRGCIAWGAGAALSPADDVLISVERPLALDAPAQMVASILSKKVAAGATHLVLDIPVGPTAKVRSLADAAHLRALFEYVAARLGLTLDVLITDGRQPVGRGIGPALEARDVMQVLANAPEAPADLRDKALALAARMIEFDAAVRDGSGLARARSILESGAALARMQAIIQAQGAHAFDPAHPPLATLGFDVVAPAAGRVVAIDNLQLARIAGLAGAPKARGAGVDLAKKLDDPVAAGEVLYRVHAAYPSDLQFARRLADRASGYSVGTAAQRAPRFEEP